MSKEIVVIQERFVVMGEVEEVCYPDGKVKEVRVTGAKCIRKWGTTRGLGEIALNGPTKETVLDEYSDVIVPLHACIMRLKCVYVEGKKK